MPKARTTPPAPPKQSPPAAPKTGASRPHAPLPRPGTQKATQPLAKPRVPPSGRPLPGTPANPSPPQASTATTASSGEAKPTAKPNTLQAPAVGGTSPPTAKTGASNRRGGPKAASLSSPVAQSMRGSAALALNQARSAPPLKEPSPATAPARAGAQPETEPFPDDAAYREETAARRTARRRPAGPPREQIAANDDLPSIGGLIYALNQRPSNRPFVYAAAGSGFWFVLATVFAIVLEPGGLTFANGITGVLAIVLMLIHAIWATVVIARRNERMIVRFHRLSLVVWLIWLVPYFSPMIFGMGSAP